MAHITRAARSENPERDYLQECRELQLLILQADSILETCSEEMHLEKSDQANSLLVNRNEELDVNDSDIATNELRFHVDRLVTLSPALKQSIDILQRLEAEREDSFAQTSPLNGGTAFYASQIRELFETGDETLIVRLGEANLRRKTELTNRGCRFPKIKGFRSLKASFEASSDEKKTLSPHAKFPIHDFAPVPQRLPHQSYVECYLCLKNIDIASGYGWRYV